MFSPVWLLSFLSHSVFRLFRVPPPRSLELHANKYGSASDDVEQKSEEQSSSSRTRSRGAPALEEDHVLLARSQELLAEVLVKKNTSASDEERRLLDAMYMEKRALLPIVPRAVLPGGSGRHPAATDIIVDVGAHVGASVAQLRSVCLRCRIIAIECVPMFAAYIRKRFQDDANVDVLNVCLSEGSSAGGAAPSFGVGPAAPGGASRRVVTLYRKKSGKNKSSRMEELEWSFEKPKANPLISSAPSTSVDEIEVRTASFDELGPALGLLRPKSQKTVPPSVAPVLMSSSRPGALGTAAGVAPTKRATVEIVPKNVVPFLVKIDTEGQEADVVGSMSRFLDAVGRQRVEKMVIIIQIGWARSEAARAKETAALQSLEARGWRSVNGDFRQCPVGQGCDLVFVRSGVLEEEG